MSVSEAQGDKLISGIDELVEGGGTLLGAVSAINSDGVAQGATVGAGWAEITIDADADAVDFSLDTGAGYVVCRDTAPSQNGCKYQPNIVYRISTRGRTTIQLKRVGAADIQINITEHRGA